MRYAPACSPFREPVLWLETYLWRGPSVFYCHVAPGGCAVSVRPGGMACTPRMGGIAINSPSGAAKLLRTSRRPKRTSARNISLACSVIPVTHHTGRIPQDTAHHSPTLVANEVPKRFLCFVPPRLSVRNQLCALFCEGDDPRSLVAARMTADESTSTSVLMWRPLAVDFEIPDSHPDCRYSKEPTYLSPSGCCHLTIAVTATVAPRTNIVR